MKTKILSLSHTNVIVDSRIQKAQQVGLESNFDYLAVGLRRGNNYPKKKNCILVESSINNWLKKTLLSVNKKIIRNLFQLIPMIEILIRMLFISFKFKPQIIHANDWYVLPVAIIYKKLFNCQIIYDAHELESETNGITPSVKKLVRFIERISWNDINILVSVSQSILDWYLEVYGYKKTLLVLNSPDIRCGSESSLFPANYLRKYYKIENKSKIFIYVGNLVKGRGIELLIKAFKENPDLGFCIFLGEGALKKNIQDSNASNIGVHDVVDHKDVVNLIKSADIGICLIEDVSLSGYLSLPNKLFEYVFANLFVIGSNFPEIRRIIQKHNLGVCIENDYESFVSESFQIIEKVDVFKLKNDQGLSELSWAYQAHKLGNLYSELASS